MKKIASIVAAAAIMGAAIPAAQAWNGPWGSNMFGMDMGQSTGYGPGYYGAPGGGRGFTPWGGNMFGMDMGQSTGYGPGYYGAPVPPPVAPPAPPAR